MCCQSWGPLLQGVPLPACRVRVRVSIRVSLQGALLGVCISDLFTIPFLSFSEHFLSCSRSTQKKRPRWWDSGEGQPRGVAVGRREVWTQEGVQERTQEGTQEGGGREQMLRKPGCVEVPISPSPPSVVTLPSPAPGPNKSGASQLSWWLSKIFCPHFLATILLWGDEKALEVPCYLLRKRGLLSWEQKPQTFCDGKCPGSELMPCHWLAEWPWMSCFSSLHLSFPTSKARRSNCMVSLILHLFLNVCRQPVLLWEDSRSWL